MAEEEAEIPYQVQYDGAEETEEFLTKDGKAKISYPNGDIYEGTYLNGLRHGEGSYTFANQKGCYTGSWVAGSKDGKGEFKYPDGSWYKGCWKQDKRNGKGTYYYANGDIYCGDWVMGIKMGHGSYVNKADGSKLVGSWVDGKMSEGDWEMSGATYTGKFENGQPVGKGSMKFIVEETLAHVEEGEYVDSKWVCSSKNKIALEKKYRSDRRAYQAYDSQKDYPDFKNSNNWMSKCMTPDIYEKLRNVMTKNGYTLDMAIQTGVDNPSDADCMAVGITAGDEDSYSTFKDIFEPIIAGRHNGYPADFQHPTCLDAAELKHEGFDEQYVMSSYVRMSRSVRGFCLPSFCSRGERRKVEAVFQDVSAGLANYRDDLSGHYESFAEMSEERLEELLGKSFIFDKPVTPEMISSGLARDWPDARGAFLGDKENFLLWVNEQDHCRIISMEKNGNMKEAFERICSACNGMEEELKKLGFEYMHNDHLGYLSSCPSNLGTAMQAGAQIKIPLLSKHEKFGEILSNLRLQKSGTSEDGVVDVSNSDRLGFSELQLVQKFCTGIDTIIQLEKALESEEEIADRIPEPISTPW